MLQNDSAFLKKYDDKLAKKKWNGKNCGSFTMDVWSFLFNKISFRSANASSEPCEHAIKLGQWHRLSTWSFVLDPLMVQCLPAQFGLADLFGTLVMVINKSLYINVYKVPNSTFLALRSVLCCIAITRVHLQHPSNQTLCIVWPVLCMSPKLELVNRQHGNMT